MVSSETFESVAPERRNVKFVGPASFFDGVQTPLDERLSVMSRNSRTAFSLAQLSGSVETLRRLVDAPWPANVTDAGFAPKKTSVPTVYWPGTETVTGLASVQFANDAVAVLVCG